MIIDVLDKNEAFNKIYKHLLKNDSVTKDFIQMIKEREKNYPTGMDLSVIGKDIPNIAIPHTEPYCVKKTGIVAVKLKRKIKFNNMIDPDKELFVKFLFVILNSGDGEQTDILAHIMDFVTKDSNIKDFFNINTTEEIYNYLKKNFYKE